MADFCKQCSIRLFGEDFGDFSGLSIKDDTDNKLFPVVLCEGCGPIQVDHTGSCVSENCLENHQCQPAI